MSRDTKQIVFSEPPNCLSMNALSGLTRVNNSQGREWGDGLEEATRGGDTDTQLRGTWLGSNSAVCKGLDGTRTQR